MHRLSTLLLLALIPVAAFAVDFTDHSGDYSDGPFSKAETAAINVLTNAGAVEGNPDGTFAPKRTLNRAEFTKIALLSFGDIAVSGSDAENCFPDVPKDAWFSMYVCLAKERGIVAGNPDGLFHPERAVNYAEALKILSELYRNTLAFPSYDCQDETQPSCELKAESGAPWYALYAEWAAKRKLSLPMNLAYDAALTRGQMSRLAATYLAESQGELAAYRAAEMGKTMSSSSVASSSSSNSSTSSSSSDSSASSVSSSSSSQSAVSGFPSVSHIIVLGERSDPIASATFFSTLEPMKVTAAEVKLEREIESIDAMFVVDSQGTELGQLSLDHVADNTDKTWKGTFQNLNYMIPKSEERVLGIEVRLKERGKGGVSEELVEVDTFRISTQGEWSSGTLNSAPQAFTFPQHQTAQGRITNVKNALDETVVAIPVGNNQRLAGFRFSATAVAGVQLKIEHLEFQVSKSSDVTVTNWQLGTMDTPDRVFCSVSDGNVVSCLSLRDTLGVISGSRTLYLFGDVSLDAGATHPFLQVSLNQGGTIGQNGAIRWTDGSGHFNWVELSSPLARSTKFE